MLVLESAHQRKLASILINRKNCQLFRTVSSENQAASCLLVAYELKKVTDGGAQLVLSFAILFPLLN